MGLFRRRERSDGFVRGFTAAATLIDLKSDDGARREIAQQKKRPLQWQRDAWRYADELSEARTYGRIMGDAQSRVKLFPAILPDDPDEEPTPATKTDGIAPRDVDTAIALLDRLQSEEGDRKEIQRLIGLNLSIAGEVWLVGTEGSEDYRSAQNPEGERWRVCSVEELTTQDDRWAIRPYDGARWDELEYLDQETTTLIRIYRRHGRFRGWPDGAMRAANLICEELLLATQSIMGSLRSRIPAGILPIPDDIEEEEEDDEDEEQELRATGMDPTLAKLLKHLTTPQSDPRSAASLVPFLLRVPKDALDKIKLIDIYKGIDAELGKRIEQLITRFAIAVDMPPEMLTGSAGLNHWSAWIVGEDAVRNHFEPYTQLYCSGLTDKFYRPRLDMAGVPNAARWTIGWDARELIAHPDRKQNAQDGWDRIVLSDATYVTSLGFSEDDMPDKAERTQRIEEAQLLKTSAGPVDGASTNKAPPDAQQIATAAVETPGEIVRSAMAPGPAGRLALARGMAANGASRHLARGIAEGMTAGLRASSRPQPSIGHAWAAIERQLQRDLLVASDAALRRMVERGQARVASRAARAPLSGEAKPEGERLRSLAKNLSADRLVHALGRDGVEALGLSDEELVAGGIGALSGSFLAWVRRARDQAVAALRRLGVDPDARDLDAYDQQAEMAAREGLSVLEAALAAAAAALIFGAPSPQRPEGESDSTLAASPRDVRDALTAAGGGPSADGPEVSGLLGGADFAAFLDSLPDFDRSGWVWEVGAPERPFEPHQALDGVEFFSWSDDQLAAPADEFPYVSFYSPSDHDGCECNATPSGDIATATLVEEPPEE